MAKGNFGVPPGFKIEKVTDHWNAETVFVVTKGDKGRRVRPDLLDQPEDVQAMIVEAVESIRSEEAAEEMEKAERARAYYDEYDRMFEQAMRREKEERGRSGAIYTTDDDGTSWVVGTPIGDAIAFRAPPVVGPLADITILKAAYTAAQNCDYLTTLEIGDAGIVIVMRDGDDYTTGTVPWATLTGSVTGNPVAKMIGFLAQQRENGEW